MTEEMVSGKLFPWVWVKWKVKEECTKEKLVFFLWIHDQYIGMLQNKIKQVAIQITLFKRYTILFLWFLNYGFWTGCMLTHRLLYKTKWTTWTNTLLLDSRLQGTPSRWVPCITWAIEMFVDTLRSFFLSNR